MVYDEYDELASAERIIIEPQTGLNRDSSGSNGSNGSIGPNGPIGSQDKTSKSTSLDKDNDLNDDESSKSVSLSH